MDKRAGALAGLLVLTLGSGVVAQSPSPEPPPWFGGRVEMPEHGFAVTLPEHLVALDPGGDVDGQLRALQAPDEGLTEDVLAGVRRELTSARMDGVALTTLAFDSESSNCRFRVLGDTVPLDEFVGLLHSVVLDDENRTDVEPPTPAVLPAGRARKLAVAYPGSSERLVFYFVDGAGVRLWLACLGQEPPADDWLSIAETIEFLPAEE